MIFTLVNLIRRLLNISLQRKENRKMYINKVVFLEAEDVRELREAFPHLIQHTDYDTTELINNMISDAREDWEDYRETFDLPNTLTYEDFKEEVTNAIGQDLFEALDTGAVDFCLVCP